MNRIGVPGKVDVVSSEDRRRRLRRHSDGDEGTGGSVSETTPEERPKTRHGVNLVTRLPGVRTLLRKFGHTSTSGRGSMVVSGTLLRREGVLMLNEVQSTSFYRFSCSINSQTYTTHLRNLWIGVRFPGTKSEPLTTT